MSKLKFLFCILFLSIVTTSISYADDLVQKMKNAGIKINGSWIDTKGGRSWSIQDEINFDSWIADPNQVPADILTKLGIAHDCADVAVSLRIIYGVKEGLAIKLGSLSSTVYFDKPTEMIKKANKDISTGNISGISYEIDYWNPVNYNGGNFLLYDGHVRVVRGINKDNGLMMTIESTVPPKIRTLKEIYFFDEGGSGWGVNTQVRRFFSSKRVEGCSGKSSCVIDDKNTAFAVHPPKNSKKLDFICACIEGPTDFCKNQLPLNMGKSSLDKAPFWQSIQNLIQMHKTGIRIDEKLAAQDGMLCPHNLIYDARYTKNGEVAEKPNYAKIINVILTDVCKIIQDRVYLVQEGYAACRGASGESIRCTSDSAGDFSTPSRDSKLAETMMAAVNTGRRLLPGYNFSDYMCSVDFMSKDRPDENKKIDIKLFHSLDQTNFFDEDGDNFNVMSLWTSRFFMTYWGFKEYNKFNTSNYRDRDEFRNLFRMYLGRLQNYLYDPKTQIPLRWGCDSLDTSFNCMGRRNAQDEIVDATSKFNRENSPTIREVLQGKKSVQQNSAIYQVIGQETSAKLVAVATADGQRIWAQGEKCDISGSTVKLRGIAKDIFAVVDIISLSSAANACPVGSMVVMHMIDLPLDPL